MELEKWGFDSFFQDQAKTYLEQGFHVARIITQFKNNYILITEQGVMNGKLSGKFLYQIEKKRDYPTVGDWIVIQTISNDEVLIHALLPRKSYFARKQVISGGRKIKNGMLIGGNIEEQIIGSNIDIAFIVSGLDNDFNLRKIERYITLVLSSKVKPVILLNKCDLYDDISTFLEKIKKVSLDISVHPISALNNINMDIFNQYLQPGKTIIFLGSSGVGKSTIVNYFFGEEIQKTNSVSDSHGKGRHTTTSVRLLQHNSGCLLMDTPGMRELQLWANEEVLSESFEDIEQLSMECKFKDCKHDKEIGCAIKKAIEEGTLSIERFKSYQNQLKELKELKNSRKVYERDKFRKEINLNKRKMR